MGTLVGPPGLLIAIEGIDGAGKTTQAGLIAAELEQAGLEVVRTKEPTNGSWGRKLRASAATGRMSPNDEYAAFVADRREHVATLIGPAIAAGKIVIVDRYYFSTAAYQGVRGLDPIEILRTNEEFAPQPDLLVLLDIDPTEGTRRIAARGDEGNLFEREEDLRKSASIFAGIDKPYLFRLDGNRSQHEICAAILLKLYEGARRPHGGALCGACLAGGAEGEAEEGNLGVPRSRNES